MKTSEEFKNEISQYLLNSRFKEVLVALGVEPNLEGIEQYLEVYPVKYLAEKKFLKSIKSYLENYTIPRHENGFADSTDMLRIPSQNTVNGLRMSGKYLGQDGQTYIKKQAEGVKGNIFNEEGKYNPTMAQSVFEYLGEKVSKSIPAFEGFPYFYTLSEYFLEKNQSLIQLSSPEFQEYFTQSNYEGKATNALSDRENSITHSEIISAIDLFIRKRYENKLPDDVIEKHCRNAKIDYAVQETIKEIIYSIDQNTGNTSLLITKLPDGNEEISISPAYDLDLSFNIGYNLLHLHGDYNNNKFYRTTKTGGINLNEIIEEFSNDIPGYTERLKHIISKLNNNYIEQILDKSFVNSGVGYFKSEKAKENYGPILMRRVAEIKQAYKNIVEKDERNEEIVQE